MKWSSFSGLAVIHEGPMVSLKPMIYLGIL